MPSLTTTTETGNSPSAVSQSDKVLHTYDLKELSYRDMRCLADPFACPPGWRRHERLCYYFSEKTETKSWIDAEAACASMQSDLGYIGSGTVQSFITGQSSPNPTANPFNILFISQLLNVFLENIDEYFWMGFNDRRQEGRYSWDHMPGYYMVS